MDTRLEPYLKNNILSDIFQPTNLSDEHVTFSGSENKPKRLLTFNGLQGDISEKVSLFITTAVRVLSHTLNLFFT